MVFTFPQKTVELTIAIGMVFSQNILVIIRLISKYESFHISKAHYND